MILLVLSFALGVSIPHIILDLGDDSWQEQLSVGMFICFGAFVWIGFRRIGRELSVESKRWWLNSVVGVTILVFLFSLLSSGLSALFVLIPIPLWLLVAFASLLGLLALALAVNEGTR